MKKVLVPLAAGFEEIEAVTLMDVLRRAGVEVVSAGLEPGAIRGSHDIPVVPDRSLDEVADTRFDAIVLPGGMPGARHLRDDPRVQRLLERARVDGRWVAAICAAPIALGPSGLVADRVVTTFPGFADQVPARAVREDRVVVDGRVVTSRGPGTALEFALTLVEKLVGGERAAALAETMLVHRAAPAFEVSPGS